MNALDRPVRECPLAIVDVETTGLDPRRGHRVCEVAVLRYDDGQPTATWQQLVNPQRPIEPGAYDVNGISDEMVADAPTFAEIAPRVVELTQGAILVGHNVWFDTRFLAAEMDRLGQPPIIPPACLDTLTLARALLELPRYSLTSVSSALRVRVHGRAHRALADVTLTWGVLIKLLDFLAEDDVITLQDVLQVQRASSYYLPQDHFQVPAPIQRALSEGLALQIQYADAAGRTTQRRVNPMRVVAGAECPALEAYCHLRNQIRHFRLDRIVAYDLLEPED